MRVRHGSCKTLRKFFILQLRYLRLKGVPVILKLKDVHNNPFRDLKGNPLIEAKIEELKTLRGQANTDPEKAVLDGKNEFDAGMDAAKDKLNAEEIAMPGPDAPQVKLKSFDELDAESNGDSIPF